MRFSGVSSGATLELPAKVRSELFFQRFAPVCVDARDGSVVAIFREQQRQRVRVVAVPIIRVGIEHALDCGGIRVIPF